MRILINAYAVCPGKGSEPGVGWDWVHRIAREHEVHVITEVEFKERIEAEVAVLGLAGCLVFHYLDIGEIWRQRCWNQGDWRFYAEYGRWQARALALAQELHARTPFDLVHQLNMVGYRVPGFLWKLPIPFVWGPVGGAGNVPLALLQGQPLPFQAFNVLKNLVNRLQLRLPACRRAAARAGVGFFATTGENAQLFHRAWGTPAHHLPEVGPLETTWGNERELAKGASRLVISWLGHFDSRKALHLLLQALLEQDLPGIEVHVMGNGALGAMWKELAARLKNARVIWHGRVSRETALERMAKSDAVVITSLKEENSSVTLEALSLGVPVVSFALSGMQDVVDSSCGRVVPVRSLKETVTALGLVLAELYEREDLSDLSEGALRRSKELAWDAKIAKLMDLYQRRVRE